jgi:hypothetical protein
MPPPPLQVKERATAPPPPRPIPAVSPVFEAEVAAPPPEVKGEEIAPPPARPREAVADLVKRLQQKSVEIERHLTNLAFDLSAESILLTCEAELVAHAGNISKEQSQELAILVSESFTSVGRVAQLLGEPDGRFELSQNEGSEYSFYSRSVTTEVVLSVALRAETPPGTVRYITKQTADKLAQLVAE